jgi:hypothetical protein
VVGDAGGGGKEGGGVVGDGEQRPTRAPDWKSRPIAALPHAIQTLSACHRCGTQYGTASELSAPLRLQHEWRWPAGTFEQTAHESDMMVNTKSRGEHRTLPVLLHNTSFCFNTWRTPHWHTKLLASEVLPCPR